MIASILGNYYEDFKIGKTINHNLFSLLTLNAHPLHTNLDYAESSQHKKIIVVGTLVFSLAVGITVPDISGKAIANLEYLNIKHILPVFINDTIYASTVILNKWESKTKKDRGIIHVKSLIYNQNQELVLSFERKVLIKKNDC
jgi:acyl dehydratase